jgi:hypothetical protein
VSITTIELGEEESQQRMEKLNKLWGVAELALGMEDWEGGGVRMGDFLGRSGKCGCHGGKKRW